MKIILSITIILFASYTVAAIARERCGIQKGDHLCSNYQCCSHWGYCGVNADDFCSLKQDCQTNCWSGPGSEAKAFYYPFDGEKHKYSLHAVKTQCSSLDADKPYEWRSRYGWAAFCGPIGPRGYKSCGMCLRVTNPKNNVVLKLRIVDSCRGDGLVLDNDQFDKLDRDGSGRQQSYLNVNYQFITCDDKMISRRPNFTNILASATDHV